MERLQRRNPDHLNTERPQPVDHISALRGGIRHCVGVPLDYARIGIGIGHDVQSPKTCVSFNYLRNIMQCAQNVKALN
jgi:hypothetical protein